jgi:hypothetical protein
MKQIRRQVQIVNEMDVRGSGSHFISAQLDSYAEF